MTRRLLAPLLIVVLLAGPTFAEEKLLLGFEKGAVAKWAKFQAQGEDSYSIKRVFDGATGDATEGKWAMVNAMSDRYGFLKPGNTTPYYFLQRTGRVISGYGWMSRAIETDWSGRRFLRMDFKTAVAGTLCLELEDAEIAEPVVRRFVVPAGKWVTLQVDLGEAARQRKLDLARMATLRLMVLAFERRVPRGETAMVKLDNIRLANAADKPALPVIAEQGPYRWPAPDPDKPRPLTPVSLECRPTAATAGPTPVVTFKNKQGYSPLKAKDRLIGAFAPGGLLLADARLQIRMSRDGGSTWTDLEGKTGEPARLSSNVRGHRMSILAEGRELLAAYVTYRCAGGSGRTELHFSRARYDGKRWVLGGRSVFERGIRHCADRLDLLRQKSIEGKAGRIWVAWNHLDRTGQYNIRAKFSDDDGATWQTPEDGPMIGPAFRGIPAGPYLVRDGEQVACFWRSGEHLRWSRFDGRAWGQPVEIARKTYPLSVADAEGTIFLATGRPSQVLRLDGGKWVRDSPVKDVTGLLSVVGGRLVCVWSQKPVDSGSAALAWSVRTEQGKWSAVQRVEVGPVTVESIAVPQHAVGSHLPVAFSDVNRLAINAVVIPLDK
jgi:hypothetical protein